MQGGFERLWAPWRRGAVVGPRPVGCFLCQKPREDRDRENLILERGERCFALLNLYPYNNGHLMVAPYRHLADLLDLSEEEFRELTGMVRDWVALLRRAMEPEGFNVGVNLGVAAGAGLADHLHVHVVPRWNGDTNFMPVIGDTKVMIQSLDECWKLLRAARGGG